MSEEQRRRVSEAHKGQKNVMKGGHHSEESRRHMSEAHKGQVAWNKGLTKEDSRVRAYGLAHKGKKLSEEQKIRISEATKRAMINPEIRKKISEGLKGKSSWNKGKKGLQVSWMKGKNHTEEAKIKMSEIVKKRISNPNYLKKLSEIHKERLSNPKEKKRQSEMSRKTVLGLYQSGAFPRQENTKPERQLKEELIKRGYKEGIDFIHQYKFMNKFMCDFCFPQQKVIVEVYGDFWHANPNKYPAGSILHPHQIKDIKNDRAKEAYITKVDNGTWTYLALWESDIKKDVAKCMDIIEEALTKSK